jgi:ComF family protein
MKNMLLLKQILSNLFEASLDFVFPHSCLICNKETKDNVLCHNCLDYIPLVKPPLCSVCGRPIKKSRVCQNCKGRAHIEYGRAWAVFVPPVDKVIHHFKYRKHSELATILGRAMAVIVKSDFFLKEADLIVPIPLFWWKKLRRGYNQARLLAEIISKECNMKVADILRRTKNTRTQTKLDDAARQKNVFNAFALRDNKIEDKTILLIDDVLTTGATMNECARILKQHGAKGVFSCVAAITPG